MGLATSVVLLLFILFLKKKCCYTLTLDGMALLSFKRGIRGSDGILAGWNKGDSDPCNWAGVTCDPRTKRVIVLLPFHNLWGYISPDIGKLNQLQRLALHQNSLYGSIPPDLGTCTNLRALYLRDNFLSGNIPSELGGLLELKIFDLSSNSLSGTIPTSLGNLDKLSMFNLSTNFLSGEIPQNGMLKNFTVDSFIGNLGLCGQQINEICISQVEGPATSPDSPSSIQGILGKPHVDSIQKSARHLHELLVSAFSTLGVSILLALMCFWGCFLHHKLGKKTKPSEKVTSTGLQAVVFHGDLPYTSKDVITKLLSLDETNIIGYGGFGVVHKLVMDDGSVFTVKRIGKHCLGSEQLFERELEVLGSIKHRNLVNLRGYCNVPSEQLLIYDYLPNGSLDDYLHERDFSQPPLNWGARLKISIGSARGMAYLHHDCSPRIIHRDIKSSNILLGEHLEPYVSDFGLARLLHDNDSHVSTVIAGTFGYLAPEYLQSGRASMKADVYSFGVVLLELLSGKRPNDSCFLEKGLNIVGWAYMLTSEKNLKDLLDPRCESVQMERFESVLKIAMLCVNASPDERPTMHQVQKLLEAEITPTCPSEFYDWASDC